MNFDAYNMKEDMLVLFLIILLYFSSISFSLQSASPVNTPQNKNTTNVNDLSVLLAIKNQIDPQGLLVSWNRSNYHYCKWQGVRCGKHHPERITSLNLSSSSLSGSLSSSIANLNFLQSLDLSNNQLIGNIPKELCGHHRLRYANLSGNQLEGDIPLSISNCSDLQVLDLAKNNLGGNIFAEFGFLQKLTHLNLAFNSLTGYIPPTLGYLSGLLDLNIQSNRLTGPIPTSLGNLSSLIYLHTNQNNLTGTIPPSLANLIFLIELDISHNSLVGIIPPSLGNLTSLRVLSLTTNNLHGEIPSSFGELSSLTKLDLTSNQLSGEIPIQLGKLSFPADLFLSLNEFSGKIPSSIYNIRSLNDLEVICNNLEGNLPFPVLGALPNLQYLYLTKNQFTGPIPAFLSNFSALLDIELGVNNFTGVIPPSIGSLQGLYWFSAPYNQLEAKNLDDWNFMFSLANCTNLQTLDVGFNLLQGMMPNAIANLSTELNLLALDSNQITGNIPSGIANYVNLAILQMGNNLLHGSIPFSIGNMPKLQDLELDDNMISGEIPSTLGNLSRLICLSLSNNSLEGSIPYTLGSTQKLEQLNLSHNRLIGLIPGEIMSPNLIYLDLSNNYLNGSVPSEIGNLGNTKTIDISHNKLVGEIPSTLGNCEILVVLYIQNNELVGSIAASLINLKGLQQLDVSSNLLSGEIPEYLATMPYLQYLNLSYNNFEGSVPFKGIFENISGLDIRGNAKLCGGISKINLPNCITNISSRHHLNRNEILMILGAIVLSSIIIGICGFGYWNKKSRVNNLSASSPNHSFRRVSYDELFRATNRFSSENLLGTGSFGSVYKATLSIDSIITIVAVKVLSLEQRGASRSFISECEALRHIRHRNLVKILTSCSSIDHRGTDFKALVYEFMPKGNLADWLHPHPSQNHSMRSLTFIQRLNIAIDVASALEYLHHHGPVPIIHRDLKPGNILLDDEMTAHVGDFGLAKFLVQSIVDSQHSSSTAGIKGSIGYIPPEYGMGGQASPLGDVYSYGVFLLELFTGVSPIDERFKDGLSLHKYGEMASSERVLDIMDNRLQLAEKEIACSVLVMNCGLLCSIESQMERLGMTEVVKKLNIARERYLHSDA